MDSGEVQRIKTLIRYCEARSAARTCGMDTANLTFLDMPFYQTGGWGQTSFFRSLLGERCIQRIQLTSPF